MFDVQFEIPLPPQRSEINQFCLWVIKKALQSRRCPSARAMHDMGTHKWWIMRDYSHGAFTPETYVMFVNINIDRPQLSQYNTAMVGWSPKPFKWGVWERCWRTLRRSNYPRADDNLQVIPTNTTGIVIKHLSPIAYPAQVSRTIWHEMETRGWSLVAQGETRYVG
jgi:hypothetical protein